MTEYTVTISTQTLGDDYIATATESPDWEKFEL